MATWAAGGLGRGSKRCGGQVVVGKSERALAMADEAYLPVRGDLGGLDILISASGQGVSSGPVASHSRNQPDLYISNRSNGPGELKAATPF